MNDLEIFNNDAKRLEYLLNSIQYNFKEKTYLVGNNLVTEGEKCDCVTFIIEGNATVSIENS